MLQTIQLQSRRPQTLFSIFQELEHVRKASLRDPALYIALLKYLVSDRRWAEATVVWHRLIALWLERDQRPPLDTPRNSDLDHEGLSLGVLILCRHIRRFDDAFHLVDKLGPRSFGPTSQTSDSTSSHADLNMNLINTLLRELRMVGRFEAVHLLWKVIGERYSVPRDKETLLQVLYAGNFGSIGGETDLNQGRLESLAISVAEQFSYMLRQRRKAKEAKMDHSLKMWDRQIEVSLRRPPRLPEEEFWDGMIAWQRARLIFLETMLGKHPGLMRLEALASPWIQLSQEQLNSPPFSLSPIHSHHIEFQDRSDPHEIPAYPPPVSLYPEINPDSDTFLAYIWLLGEHGLASQIPLAITWMRALNIVPSRRTLAFAFCFVEDMQNPLQHRYGLTTDYSKLSSWVESWLDKAAIPSEDQIAEARARILGRRSPKIFPGYG